MQTKTKTVKPQAGELYVFASWSTSPDKISTYFWQRNRIIWNVFKGNNVIACSFGLRHRAALLSTGALYMWGSNRFCQLGMGENPPHKTRRKWNMPQQITLEGKVVSVQCGGCHTVAIVDNGTVYAWGSNEYGQLGLGSNVNSQDSPRQLKSLPAEVTAISCGTSHTVAVINKTRVFVWGNNFSRQLGFAVDSSCTPTQLQMPQSGDIKVLSCECAYHTGILYESGDVYLWGSNLHGQLGINPKVAQHSGPHKLDPFAPYKRITNINCSYCCTAVILENGAAFVFGRNGTYCLLGLEDQEDKWTPQFLYRIPDGKKIKALSFAEFCTCAISESGEVFFWGTRFGYEHAPPTAIIHIPPEPSKRAISITSSKTDMAVILTTKMPTWVEIKPLLVGWLKDTNCSFHYSHGLPLFTLQYIIELAWNCDICLQVPRL